MDDTTIIGKNKEKVLEMIDICHKIFSFDNVHFNVNKHGVIKINSKEKELIINEDKIRKINNSEEGNSYLGFFLYGTIKGKYIKKELKILLIKQSKIIRWKNITEKQVIAIWNIVVILYYFNEIGM